MSDAAPSQPTPSDPLAEIRRRRRGVRAALDALEHSVAAASSGREPEWIAGVVERLRDLQSAFAHHVALTEGPGGLFEEVMEHAPRLAHQIAMLGNEHVAISDALDSGMDLGKSASGREGAAEIREAAIDVMSQVTRHRHSGAGLVYEAYNVDIEAAD
jgi:hypothetical protein